MLDINMWEIVGVAVDAAACYLMNRWYRNKVKDADLVNAAASYEVGEELRRDVFNSPDKSLPFVCVTGITQCIGSPLKSQYSDSTGVMQHQLYIEHKSKRTQGFWTDMKRIIKDKLNIRPFMLVGTDSGISIEVTDALSAEYLQNSLELVHDHYQPATDSLLSRGIDRLFGEITKGYQETESMLKVGVHLLGIGKVMHAGNKLLLVAPDDGRRYILTTASKQQLVRSLRSDARLLNIARWVFLVTGSAVVAYVLYREVMRYKTRRSAQRMLAELQHRQTAAGADGGDAIDAATEAIMCVVCLSQPRDVVLLNCGHICVCSQCAVALPTPKACPVCRASVDRILPTYIS